MQDVNKIKEILLKRYRHLIRKERLGKKVLGCDIEERTTKNKMDMPMRQEKYMTLSMGDESDKLTLSRKIISHTSHPR